MKRSSINDRTGKASFEWDGETVNCEYRPGVFTIERQAEMLERAKARDVWSIADLLVDTLVSWDVEEDDGTPTPITREVLGSFDEDFILALSEAVGKAREKRGRSDTGS